MVSSDLAFWPICHASPKFACSALAVWRLQIDAFMESQDLGQFACRHEERLHHGRARESRDVNADMYSAPPDRTRRAGRGGRDACESHCLSAAGKPKSDVSRAPQSFCPRMLGMRRFASERGGIAHQSFSARLPDPAPEPSPPPSSRRTRDARAQAQADPNDEEDRRRAALGGPWPAAAGLSRRASCACRRAAW